MQVQGFGYCAHTVHGQSENQQKGQDSTGKRDDMSFPDFCDNQDKHCQKDENG